MAKLRKVARDRDAVAIQVLEDFETATLSTVKSQVELVIGITNDILTGFSNDLELTLNKGDTSLDDSIGTQFKALQMELDLSQKQLAKESKKIAREFDALLKEERTASLGAIGNFDEKTQFLVESAKAAMKDALSNAETALHESTKLLSEEMGSKVLETTTVISEVLTTVSGELKHTLGQFDSELSQAYIDAQESLKGIIAEARDMAEKHAEVSGNKMRGAYESTLSLNDAIDSWKAEVLIYINTASQSIAAQLEQVAGSDSAHLDVVKNTLTGHLDKVNASLSEENAALKSIARSFVTNIETYVASARTSMMDLLQQQVTDDNTRLDLANKTLQKGLTKWGKTASKSIDKKLTSSGEEIGTILDTEVSELNSLTKNITSRLNSAFGSIISSTAMNNEGVITSIKKVAHDFEADVGITLTDVVSEFSSITGSQVAESQSVYDDLRNRLNTRLAKSVSNLNSLAAKVQKEVDASIVDQVERIDRHAQEMREEFHVHIEDITRQFMNLTQGLESTFNGLLSSQAVEARDLIASTHNEFKNTIKDEMSTLEEDSILLQQEFTSELSGRIDEIASSVASIKRTLEELNVNKRYEMSKSIESTIQRMEDSIRSTEESLQEMQSGTVKQFGENLIQVSKEFESTTDMVGSNIKERLATAVLETKDILSKSSSGIRTTVDTFISEELDSKQRVLSGTSKKLDRLASQVLKKADSQIEEYQKQLSTNEAKSAKSRSTAKDKVIESIDARRVEAELALNSSSVWIESAVDNMESSLDNLGTRLNNDILAVQNSLAKTTEKSTKILVDHGNQHIDRVEELGNTLFQRSESILRSTASEFDSQSSINLNSGVDNLTGVPNSIMTDVEKTLKNTVAETQQKYNDLANDFAGMLTEFEHAMGLSSEEFRALLERVSIQVTQNRDLALEQANQSAVVSNQHASRKFESIGIDLKANLSKGSFEILKKVRSEIGEKNLEISQKGLEVTDLIEQTALANKTQRDNDFSEAISTLEKELKRWTSGHRKSTIALKTDVEATLGIIGESVEASMNTLEAIRNASEDIIAIPTENTWFLIGNDEIGAHMMDMAQRAKESVILSVLSSEDLDTKLLSKVKDPKIKVLIVPESEEPVPALESLKGWRIWETDSPVLLSIIDENEIVIGGSDDSDQPLAVASSDASYLRLYHDIIGPMLINQSKR
jgi:hypothetical protein